MDVFDKAQAFALALNDVYEDDEDRQLYAMPKMRISDDVTEDGTAMLLAVYTVMTALTGEKWDIIDFTHILNKLAVQYVMDGMAKMDGGAENG